MSSWAYGVRNESCCIPQWGRWCRPCNRTTTSTTHSCPSYFQHEPYIRRQPILYVWHYKWAETPQKMKSSSVGSRISGPLSETWVFLPSAGCRLESSNLLHSRGDFMTFIVQLNWWGWILEDCKLKGCNSLLGVNLLKINFILTYIHTQEVMSVS